jgi:hypothetical protein
MLLKQLYSSLAVFAASYTARQLKPNELLNILSDLAGDEISFGNVTLIFDIEILIYAEW